jgi:hypothetical protein
MASERRREDVPASAPTQAAADRPDAPRMSRRQALGRMSAVAAAGAAAWVAPEILTAKPAAGAVLSGTTAGTTVGGVGGAVPEAIPVTEVSTSGSSEPPLKALAGSLATTGMDLQRDAEIGLALVAGGWAMQHWASRPSAAAADGAPGPATDAGSTTPAE